MGPGRRDRSSAELAVRAARRLSAPLLCLLASFRACSLPLICLGCSSPCLWLSVRSSLGSLRRPHRFKGVSFDPQTESCYYGSGSSLPSPPRTGPAIPAGCLTAECVARLTWISAESGTRSACSPGCLHFAEGHLARGSSSVKARFFASCHAAVPGALEWQSWWFPAAPHAGLWGAAERLSRMRSCLREDGVLVQEGLLVFFYS